MNNAERHGEVCVVLRFDKGYVMILPMDVDSRFERKPLSGKSAQALFKVDGVMGRE